MWKLLIAQMKEAVPAGPVAPEGGVPEGAAEGATGSGNPFGGMLPMIAIFIIVMYFLMIRPQQKRDKERREMLGSLAKGDSVVTSGGICGTVTNLSESNVVLKVDDNVTMEFVRSAIAQVTARAGESKKSK